MEHIQCVFVLDRSGIEYMCWRIGRVREMFGSAQCLWVKSGVAAPSDGIAKELSRGRVGAKTHR